MLAYVMKPSGFPGQTNKQTGGMRRWRAALAWKRDNVLKLHCFAHFGSLIPFLLARLRARAPHWFTLSAPPARARLRRECWAVETVPHLVPGWLACGANSACKQKAVAQKQTDELTSGDWEWDGSGIIPNPQSIPHRHRHWAVPHHCHTTSLCFAFAAALPPCPW